MGTEKLGIDKHKILMWVKANTFGDTRKADQILHYLDKHHEIYYHAIKDIVTHTPTSGYLTHWMKLMTQIKKLGREVKPFDPKVWGDESICAMIKVNIAKYSQDDYARRLLLETEEAILAEASTFDLNWGTGVSHAQTIKGSDHWRGKNYLGQILMEIRSWLLHQ